MGEKPAGPREMQQQGCLAGATRKAPLNRRKVKVIYGVKLQDRVFQADGTKRAKACSGKEGDS